MLVEVLLFHFFVFSVMYMGRVDAPGLNKKMKKIDIVRFDPSKGLTNYDPTIYSVKFQFQVIDISCW